MERTNLAAVLPIDCGWSDVGSWSAVWDVSAHDAEGNAATGPVVFHNSRNSLARSDETILTAVVGVENIVVVTTPDAVLVTSRDKAEDVKGLVEQLKAQNRQQAVTAFADLSAVGLLPGRRRRWALSGEAHRGEAERQALAAKAFPSCRTLGGRPRHSRGHRRDEIHVVHENSRPIFQSAASTASPIRARSHLN